MIDPLYKRFLSFRISNPVFREIRRQFFLLILILFGSFRMFIQIIPEANQLKKFLFIFFVAMDMPQRQSHGLHLKPIPDTPNCFNILRVCSIRLNFLPDFLNMHRHGCDIPDRIHVPDLPEQLLLGKYMVGVFPPGR